MGIRNGRTVVMLEGPDDPMVVFDAPGREGDTARGTSLDLVATITAAEGETARLVTNGVPGNSFSVDGDPFEMMWTVDAPSAGQDRDRVEVLVGGQPRTITSHIWVEFEPEPATGTSSGGAADESGGNSTGAPMSSSTTAAEASSGRPADAADEDSDGCQCTHQRTRAGWALFALFGLLARRRG